MSIDLIVYAQRAAVPSPSDWQTALKAAEFPVELDTDFNLDTSSGFRPCRFRGSESGFEYFSSLLSRKEQQELGAPDGTDFQVRFVTHSDMKEMATSLLAAAALCEASKGLLVDPQSGEEIGFELVLDWARSSLAAMEIYLK